MLLLEESEPAWSLFDLLPFGLAIPAVVLVLALSRRVVARYERRVPGRRLGSQLIMLVLTLIGVVVLLLLVPAPDEIRTQLLGTFAILLSAALALASTTFLGNLLAGLMLKAVGNFQTGDFIRCGEHFGRVSERGALHTEIQTEDRELTTLPNLFLVTNPTTVIRNSGTIVSARVSLGYDVPRARAQELMLAAAEAAGLEDPFFQIKDLGDFSVTYRVAGLLADVKEIFSSRTRLRAEVLDALHAGGIEVASPTLMNTRPHSPRDRFVPGEAVLAPGRAGSTLERLAFDKAELAESVERFKGEVDALHGEREGLEKRLRESTDEIVRRALEDELSRLEKREERLGRIIQAREEYLSNDESRAGS